MEFTPIGVVRSPFSHREGMPIQSVGAAGIKGRVEVFSQFAEGLKDLDGFSHIILLTFFHCSQGFDLRVIPFLDSQPRGVFATRAPRRPNPIGLSVVRLESVDDHVLHIDGVDILDGTPVLDIKPYVPEFDSWQAARIGWLAGVSKEAAVRSSDDRFSKD